MSKRAKNWYRMKAAANGQAAEIVLYGDVGGFGITADSFRDDFEGLGNVATLNIRINSDGGDVFTGFAIYNMLQRSLARKVVIVDGLAASIASVIAMAGDEIVMPKNSMLMIHNPWGGVVGQSQEIISFGEALNDMRDGIVAAYVDKSGLSESKIVKMMDKETWLSAAKAVELGLATEVAQPVNMQARADFLNLNKFANAPESLGASLRGTTMAKDKNSERARAKARDELFGGDDDEDGEDADTVRASIVETARNIRAAVKLAKAAPELADKFIEDGLTLEQVVAKLGEKPGAKDGKNGKGKQAKAADAGETEDEELSSHNDGQGNVVAELDNGKIWDKFNAFARTRGRRERHAARHAD